MCADFENRFVDGTDCSDYGQEQRRTVRLLVCVSYPQLGRCAARELTAMIRPLSSNALVQPWAGVDGARVSRPTTSIWRRCLTAVSCRHNLFT